MTTTTTTLFSVRNVALVIFVAVFVERHLTTRREGHVLQSHPSFVLFRTSDVATERFLSSSSSSSSDATTTKTTKTTTTPTEEILAVVTVGWQISSSNERQTHLQRILENYRNVCDDESLSFKRVTVAIAAYVDDEDALTTFLVTSSGVVGNNTVLYVRTNGDWRIVEDKEGNNGSVRIERMESEKEVNINQKKKKKKSASSCEFAVNLELFSFREIDTKKSYMTPGDLSIRHRDIFLRRILADDDEDVNGDKVLFIVQEDDVFLDEKHVSLFLETSKITERMNDDREEEEEEENFYHPFFFDYEKDSNDIVYADWRVNAGVVQKFAWNNQTVFVSAKASGGGRSLMIRGRSRLRDLLFTNKSTSSNSSKTVSELEEWLDPLAAHPGEFNLEIATNRWIERRVRAKRGDSSAEKKALFLLPLSSGGNRSLETLLESSGIWHASNTYVERRIELIVSSSANKNQETLERLRLDELRQIFHSCLTENDENECFRCLQNMDTKAAKYRARVFVDFEREEEEDDEDDEDEERKADRARDGHDNEHSHPPRRREKKTQKLLPRRRVDVSFSCAAAAAK